MFQIVPLDSGCLEQISLEINRSQLQYHEYKFLQNIQLFEYFKVKNFLDSQIFNPLSFVVLLKSKIKGFVSLSKDGFDSEMFGFDCFKITELIVFSNEIVEVDQVVSTMVEEIVKRVLGKSQKNYISFSLNNNTENAGLIFNNMVKNNFYFIHTLLTFSSSGFEEKSESNLTSSSVNIRVVSNSDVEGVAALAQKSFKYSRFHMDPYLDDQKANILLKTSAENSILEHFVDIMFVAEIDNKIVGYYSGKKRKIKEFDKTVGEAVISAVDSSYRGMGIFSQLDNHLLKWFSNNTDFAEMGTYLSNYPVHKTWINKNIGLIRGVHQFSKLV